MENITKICSKCKKEKSLSEYYKAKKEKDGLQFECKACHNECNRIWVKNNYAHYIETNKQWVAENRERVNLNAKTWRLNNLEKSKAIQKKSYLTHPDRSNKWRLNNPEKSKNIHKKSNIKARGTISGRLNLNISTKMSRSLHGGKGNRHWETLVGYTVNELQTHLEKQFALGMTWENYGKWHIDHITPIASFNYQGAEEESFKRCWALDNLQPLWAIDNIKKGANITRNKSIGIGWSW